MNNTRKEWIDIAKAIGIILVVFGHLALPARMVNFIYSFHVPLFFFLSGMTCSIKNNSTVTSFFRKKIDSIVVPYFIFSMITYGFWVLIGRRFGADATYNIEPLKPFLGIFYSNGVDFWMQHNTPLWFLTCLFVTEAVFYLIFKLKRTVVAVVLIAALAALGFFWVSVNGPRLPWGINIALCALPIFSAGYFSKSIFDGLSNKSLICITICLCLFVSIIVSSSNGRIDMNYWEYGNVALFYVGAFSGVLMVISLSKLIECNGFLAWVGKNTLVILCLHNLAFTFVRGIMVYIFHVNLNVFTGAIFLNVIFCVLSIFILIPVAIGINNYAPWIIGKKRLLSPALNPV